MLKVLRNILFILTAAVMLLLCACQGLGDPAATAPQSSEGATLGISQNAPVYITEISSANHTLVADENGRYWDYIEIYNSTSGRISLKGYYLSDSQKKPQKWQFPDIYIEAGQYMVIFASGLDKTDELHTNFAISATSGESITLVAPDGTYASNVEIPSCNLDDVSYGLVQSGADSGTYAWFATPTPGAANTGNYHKELDKLEFYLPELYITEYLTSGDGLLDKDGDPCDFIEIYNPTNEKVDLSGMFLSDDGLEFDKWQFPQGVCIEAGGYLTVLASGKNISDGEIHTNFKLSEADKTIMLSSTRGSLIHQVDILPAPSGISVGFEQKQGVYFDAPTPGAPNGQGVDDWHKYFQSDIVINRVSATAVSQNDWDYDVISLQNTSQQDVNIAGYTLQLSQNKTYTFGELTLKAGQETVLYASGETPGKPEKNRIYLPFKVSVSGETVLLFDQNGKLRDEFTTGKLRKGVTVTRQDGKRVYIQNGVTADGYTTVPIISADGGYAQKGDKITVSVPSGVKVYYTTDGSVPDSTDKLYANEIELTKSCSLRFIAYADGKLASDVVTRTFLIEEKHSLPIFCISGDPDDYFGNSRGIFINYEKNWEREAAMEFFTVEGDKALDFNAGIQIHGAYSRSEKQKSMAVYLRNDYGCGDITYPFFANNSVTTLGSFVLRTGGQDWNRGKLRDSFVALVAKDTTNLAVMDTLPVAVYFNGEYFGLYFMREKLGKDYFSTHYGIDQDDLEYLRANTTVLHGSNKEYKELIEYVKNHDLSKKEYYDYVCSQVDILSYIDWWVFETWFVNTDSGNIKFFRDKESGKWTWALFDMDWMLFSSTYKNNYLSKVYASGHGVSSMFSTVLIRGLLKNAEFKELFLSRYSYHVNNTLNPDRLYKIIDSLADTIRDEIPRQHERWGAPSLSSWEYTIKRLKIIFIEKIDLTKKHMKSVFKLSQAEVDKMFSPSYTVTKPE